MRWTIFLFALTLVGADRELRLVTLDPAHFHAAQLHAAPMAGFSRDAWVYAPVGKDLIGHLNFIAGLKARSPAPDHWRYHIYSGDNFLERMLKDRPGDVVVLSGRNTKTIDYIKLSLEAGLHVLADKPWIIDADQFPKLEQALDLAERKGVIAYDCMSQRFEIAYILQRELVNDREIFGAPIAGTPEQPAVETSNTHYLLKRFGGVVNLRPAAYFDIRQQGESFADVGTHVVDLAHWILFPEQALDYRKDIRILSARRWPTMLTLEQFTQVTGENRFPSYLEPYIRDGKLEYFTNNAVTYTVRGHYVKLQVAWDFESPSGAADSIATIYRGTKSEVMARQSKAENYIPEVYVTPKPESRAQVIAALSRKYPGRSHPEANGSIRVSIPPSQRRPDVEYFLLIAGKFAGYVRHPETLPKWEKANMLAKYWITTQGVKAARSAK
jgi:predicted dehydrogenase